MIPVKIIEWNPMSRKIFYVLAALAVAMQLIRPDFTNPPVDVTVALNAEPQVKLERINRARQVINNGMRPKTSYLAVHEDAALSGEEKRVLERFFDEQIQAPGGTSDGHF